MPLNSKTIVLILLMQCLALTDAGRLSAQDTAAEFFEKKIRPALVEHCVRCHGEDKVQGGLRLDTREGWKAGGDSGHAIVAGDDESLLLQAIEYDDISLEMPPRGKLPEKTIAAFRSWILSGAFDPRSNGSPVEGKQVGTPTICLLYTSPSPRDRG